MQMRTETGMVMQGATHGRALAEGDAAEIFVRPEAIRVARDPAELAGFDNRIEGTVTSLLFNGAASRILVRDAAAGEDVEVNLPQSGEYAGLDAATRCRDRLVRRPGQLLPGGRGLMRAGTRLGFYLLLMPLLLWLALLIVIPHVDMFLVSIRERVGVRQHDQSRQLPCLLRRLLYIRTFVRTAVMLRLTTAITLVIAFPVSYYIAKIARGRLQQVLFMLCLIPFYVSELVRTFGWMILLRETGIVSNLLQWTGLADQPVEMPTTMPRSWSASSTPRCCSWSSHW
ncbi:MAG: TOBE domain-containing protein [Paracoccaceae bacterium]